MTNLYEAGDINTVDGGDQVDDVDDLDVDDEFDEGDEIDEGIEGNEAALDGGTPLAVLTYLARALSNDPDAVVIETEDRRGGLRLNLHVAPDDMGRVIGRRGKTAQAIRTLVNVAGAKDGVQASVDIVDDWRDMSDLLTVGRVTKAHGLRGEVVVQLWTDLTERLNPGSVLTTPRGTLTVERARPFQDRWIVQFEGLVDRSQAERMRGVELAAPAVDVPGKLWVHELVGARVLDADGSELGVVGAVESNPASDLLVLEGGGLIPLRFVTDRDAGAGTLTVDIPDGLLDLA